uniref:GM10650 n=1 Tax=Mus musculus TaxID=10090 RepID=I3PQX1_MOUSE|nr:Gm10650 [Mus musculus]
MHIFLNFSKYNTKLSSYSISLKKTFCIIFFGVYGICSVSHDQLDTFCVCVHRTGDCTRGRLYASLLLDYPPFLCEPFLLLVFNKIDFVSSFRNFPQDPTVLSQVLKERRNPVLRWCSNLLPQNSGTW